MRRDHAARDQESLILVALETLISFHGVMPFVQPDVTTPRISLTTGLTNHTIITFI